MGNDPKPKRKFLFKVDIMIEEETNGRALEALLHLLNTDKVEDYKVLEGIELGKKIEQSLKETLLQRHATKTEADKPAPPKPQPEKSTAKASSGEPTKKTEEPYSIEKDPHRLIWDQLGNFQANNILIRLSILKGKGVKASMPCRIINTDPPSGNLSVYHVDEKKVYLVKINEIDDFEIT
ncbi:hypothetical protein [Paenibacillus sp. YYML68]|uniref:hypothetical protein n=1 Tax=Paenibacillus sp. YYML68 TaxID=2909250 RepID=UPI0024908C59|nr:hypothetical protein [Paenibacillus sp. YYML68]